MKKIIIAFTLCCVFAHLHAQLSVELIMQDPKISVGALPSNPVWSEDSKTVYFSWNPEGNKADSLYAVSVSSKKPAKVTPEVRRALPSAFSDYNRDRSKKVYAKNGDIYLLDCKTGATRLLVNTVENESNPYFSMNGDKIIFSKANNLFSVNILNGEWTQHTNFQTGAAKPEPKLSEQEKWQKQDQLSLFERTGR